jgi:hypothetical protein
MMKTPLKYAREAGIVRIENPSVARPRTTLFDPIVRRTKQATMIP